MATSVSAIELAESNKAGMQEFASPPPLPMRAKLTREEMAEAVARKAETNLQLIHKVDPQATVNLGPSSHVNEETGELVGVVYNVASNVDAKFVIKTEDIGGGRSLYEIPMEGIPLVNIEKKMSTLLETLRSNKELGIEFVDESIPFEQKRKVDVERISNKIVVLGSKSTSIGFYSRVDAKETKYFMVIQNYQKSKALEDLITIGSIQTIYDSRLYTDAIEFGSLNRDLTASILLANLRGPKDVDNLKARMDQRGASVDNSILIKPIATNQYNLIIKDGKVGDRYSYYDHCFFSEKLGNAMLLGAGYHHGFVYMHKKLVGTSTKSTSISFSHESSRGLMPMGMVPSTKMASGGSSPRRGESLIVTWGSNVPNPKSEGAYEEFSIDGKFYKSFANLGYDFSDKDISFLKPVKVYVSTPRAFVEHLTLKQWLNFKMDPKDELVFLPYDHPFVRTRFMPLYIEVGEPSGLMLKSLIVAQKSDQRGFYFSRPHLIRLIQMDPNQEEIWNLA